MFESSLVDSPHGRAPARLTLLPLSIAAHTLLISAAVVGAAWNVTFPGTSPDQFESLRTIRSVPLPPGGPSDGGKRQETPAALRRPATVGPVTPLIIPEEVRTATALNGTETEIVSNGGDGDVTDGSGSGAGAAGGIDGGVPHDGLSPDEATIHPVGRNVKAPLLLHKVEPAYPGVAYALKREGSVIVECTIDRNGTVQSVRVISSTFAPFSDAAVDAVRQWRFRPGTLGGRPVNTLFRLTVDFRLR
ncbi:MAG TPA: energy transducer TonB [Thermoanaerobaculia bacterium]|nr:energy transducer TonB [Thermoanaerobaculia bacterium]